MVGFISAGCGGCISPYPTQAQKELPSDTAPVELACHIISSQLYNQSFPYNIHEMSNHSKFIEPGAPHPQGILYSILQFYLSRVPENYHTLAALVLVALLYLLAQLAITAYRLSRFHPLSRFPGPMLARATGWYRTYHEVFRKGRMIEELQRLHKIYGPVVRFGPNDLHFDSPTSYETIYSAKAHVTKDPWLYKCFSEDQSSFGYTDSHHAKIRRQKIAPFFSRQNILSLQDVIAEKVEVLCQRLEKLEANTISQSDGVKCAVVDLGSAIRSMTMDVIMSFCFGECMGALDHPTFRHPVIQFMEDSLPLLWVFKHFPIVQKMMLATPQWVTAKTGAHGIVLLKRNLTRQLDTFLRSLPYYSTAGEVKETQPGITVRPKEIIFHRLLDANKVPTASYQSLFDEAQALFVGGSDTVGNTLTVGAFHILSNPDVYSRLQKELHEVWPSGSEYQQPEWQELEKLPYLTAVIKESLRVNHGVVSPLSRIVPPQGLVVDDMFIPHGTVIASSAPFIHLNESIFPDANTFNPERWLDQKGKELERYLVAFSRGPRACVGINLAWCELYFTFAMLFRRLNIELYETTAKDVEYNEFFVPSLRGKVRAKVTRKE